MSLKTLVAVAIPAVLLCSFGCRERAPSLRMAEFPSPAESAGPPSMDPPPRESLIAVLARPEDFDGRRVAVQGVLHLQFEGDQLCLDPGSLQYMVTQNCLWVRLAEGEVADHYDEIARRNGRYALVEGRISAADQGHFSLFRASILDVNRVAFIEPPGRGVPGRR